MSIVVDSTLVELHGLFAPPLVLPVGGLFGSPWCFFLFFPQTVATLKGFLR